MKVAKIDHQGKTVFVGIDVHKKTYTICARGELMRLMKKGNLPANPKDLCVRLQSLFPGAVIKTAYEAGFSGFVLHRELKRAGIENIVVNAASIEVAANNRVKTDKRDAEKLSHHLSVGLLEKIRVPEEEEELGRLLPRTRDQLVRQRTRVGNQIKSKLMQFGLVSIDDDRVMGPALIEEYERKDLPFEVGITIKSLGTVYRSLSSEISKLEKKMKQQAEENQAVEAVYLSAPGVGAISARILASELGDMRQFSNQKQLAAFLGLTPTEHSSGEKERKGRITRQGRGYLRGVLVEVAWRAIKKDEVLTELYQRIKVTRGGKRAIVAVARRIIGHIRACFFKGVIYNVRIAQGRMIPTARASYRAEAAAMI